MDMMSPTVGKIAVALSKAQFEIKGAVKSASNNHFKSEYAELEFYIQAAKEPLFKNELALSQQLCILPNGNPGMMTLLIHSSGEWIRSMAPLIMKNQDAHSYGSAITYTRRYSLGSILSMAQIDKDDDGNEAMAPEKPKPTLLDRPEKQQIREVPNVRFLNYETCGTEIKEYLSHWAASQKKPVEDLVKSINESAEKYKLFFASYENWKAKRAQVAI